MYKKKHDVDKTAANNPDKRMNNSSSRDFPGYPHYPSSEDIMDSRNNNKRVNTNVEGLPGFHNSSNTPHRLMAESENTRNDVALNPASTEDDLGIAMGTEADVTDDEKQLLEDDMYYPTKDEDSLRQSRLDDRDLDGEKLNEESLESGGDLDINAEQNKNSNEAIGQEDEENEYWSLGNDDNDNTVEGTP
jgi:hypothetical protein